MILLSLPSVHFWCCTVFFWFLAQPCLRHYNQEDCNLGTKAARYWSDVIAEIFLPSKLVFPACVVWCKDLLSSHSLAPGQHYLPQALDVGLYAESESIWEGELRHNVIITCDHPKHHDMDWVFGFYQYQYIAQLAGAVEYTDCFSAEG